MQGREINFCNVQIQATVQAWKNSMRATVAEALLKRPYGKQDTLGLDAIPEIIAKRVLKSYSDEVIFVTEEADDKNRKIWPRDPDKAKQPLMMISDPLDRSKHFKSLLLDISTDDPSRNSSKIGDMLENDDIARELIKRWEEGMSVVDEKTGLKTEKIIVGGKPAIITGPTISITSLFKGKIIASVIVNLITQHIFLAAPMGIYYMKLPSYLNEKTIKKIDLEFIVKNGKKLDMISSESVSSSPEDYMRFVTFLGKSGYKENFEASMIFLKDVGDPYGLLRHKEPGGPARILFLSELQRKFGPIGFIMANGEKIHEWFPWLPFVKYAKDKMGNPALKVFEVAIADSANLKGGVLMSTSQAYSIFQIEKDEELYIDISFLRRLDQPSHFRSMLVVVPADNDTITHIMRSNGYREVFTAL